MLSFVAGADPFQKSANNSTPLALCASYGNWRGLLVSLSFLFSSSLIHVAQDLPQVQQARAEAKESRTDLLLELLIGEFFCVLLVDFGALIFLLHGLRL
jgi:hypothetical protein